MTALAVGTAVFAANQDDIFNSYSKYDYRESGLTIIKKTEDAVPDYALYFTFGQYRTIRQERFTRNFVSEKGAKVQEYLVYFKLLQRISGAKFP